MAAHFLPVHATSAAPRADAARPPAAAAYGTVTLCWLLSAGVYIAAKWAQADMPPWALGFWRPAIAGLLLLPAVRGHYAAMGAALRTRAPMLLLVGGIGLAMSPGLIYVGLQTTTAVNAGLIMALMPIVTMILARFMLGEAMGLWQAVGAAIALAGMVVIVARGDLAALASLRFNPGELWLVASALCFALYSVLLRRANFALERLPLLLLLLAAATLTALPFYIWEMLHDERTALNASGLLALAYVAAPGGALMYYLFNWSVDAFGAAKAGVFLYLQTVFIAVLAYLLLGERLHQYDFVGAALIVVGVLLVTLLKPRPA
jgi:drug/metabolite transporter (DMT)-like permease